MRVRWLMMTTSLGCGGVSGLGRRARRHRRALAFTGMGAALATTSVRRGGSDVVQRAAAVHPDFTLIRQERIPEFKTEAYLYEHASKAQVLSLVSPEDDNKVFGVTFRTPPRDSTGLPHILEHSVLCGSEKYPTKEPFVELLKGSLQTFLNAFTYPDRTCYPVASQNSQDLKNLARVYMDAVFFPRARNDPMVLAQEGWHYEYNGELSYKGVVFNEMKGVYSSPDALMQRAAQRALFPDNAYSHDSGGDPAVIPELTFEKFRSFHDEFYHPSNSRIFFYGDDDPSERLDLAAEYLNRFEARPSEDTAVAVQPLTLRPHTIKVPFPSSDAKHAISVNWVLSDEPLSPVDELGLAVLDHLLMGTSTSLLRKALTDSGLGESVIGGLSDELIQPTFSVGLKGVAEEDATKVEELVLGTLEGNLEVEDIEASLNTVEFDLREFNTGSFPKGLSFMLGSMRNWIYDRDPLQPLKFEEPLAELKKIATVEYFKNLVTRFYLANTHRVSIHMVPDPKIEGIVAAEEKARLEAAEVDFDEVKKEMDELKKIQSEPDTPEALSTIPFLKVSDLERNVKTIPRDVSKLEREKATLLTRELATTIAYADVALDLRVLDWEDLELVPLFARCLLETGTTEWDPVTLRRKIGAKTGGIDVTLLNSMRADGGTVADPEDVVYQLVLRGKATEDKTDDLFMLMRTVLTQSLFPQSRIIEMLKESKARYESSFRTSGHAYAATRLSAAMTRSGHVAEVTSGVSHYHSVLKLLELAENDFPSLLGRLEDVRRRLLRAPNPVINFTGGGAAAAAGKKDQLEKNFADFFPEETVPIQKWTAPFEPEKDNEGFVVPTQVNYVAKGGRLYAPGETPNGADAVVRRIISLDYLWNVVRVQGGAYGGSCNLNPLSGIFAFSSYRDPNLRATLDAYDNTNQYLDDLNLDQAELDKAIIASIGDLDSPMTPDQQSFQSLRHYLDGTTDEIRQQWRDDVLNTKLDDIHRFNEKLKNTKEFYRAVVFASQDAFDKEDTPDLHLSTLL
ncbi:hypothetical protein CTAYLR_001353 [Chrysophaeum taylorii]|uniref:Peptidase M16C associated domain-containing protein n=1 Tax=Chrysophaeum taylorii TaxID=2483200 RepID=A0AAD7XJK9_9STRA|nr:hypothetical protein CTAYLR_001353 [Chrysophaeum taylorii]